MSKLFRQKIKIGQPPGTLNPTGDESKPSKIKVIDYDEHYFEEREVSTIEECFSYKDKKTTTWINIDGRNVDVIEKIDDHFGIHPLVLEDVVNIGQRPKIEDYEDYLFLVVKMIDLKDDGKLDVEQVSIVLGKDYVISFQEKEGDVFDFVRERLRKSKGRIRTLGPDYLAYALMDAVVDRYFLIFEKIGEAVDEMEEEIMEDIRPEMPREIHRLKSDMIFLRKHIWPLREVIASLQKNEFKQVKKDTLLYLRDLYDHTIQVNDAIDAFRDALSGIHDIYLSTISNRMNEVMKVLTIFAALFIPLTFLAGIYGMNFENMPELKWENGYFIALSVMGVLGVSMIAYFKRKGWL